MTINQERKFSMYLALKDLTSQTTNTAIVTSLPGYNGYLTNFNANIATIQSIREQQETNHSGLAVNKKELRDDLTTKAIDVARKLVGFATTTGNTILEGEIAYNESDLKRSADTILRDKCQLIYNKANANITALASYGVTAALLAALQTSINNYIIAIPRPRLGIVSKKLATAQLVTLFDANDLLLVKMDKLVEIVHASQFPFYKNHSDARMLVNTGHGHIAVRGNVKDKNSLLPIGGVNILVRNESVEVKTKTTVKGYYQFKNLAEGIYTMKITKNGYVLKTETLNVTNGERSEIEIELEAVS